MRVQYSTKIESELRDKLIKLSQDTRIPQSKLIDEALEDLLEKYKKLNFPRRENPDLKSDK